jgi:hypothetical protein
MTEQNLLEKYLDKVEQVWLGLMHEATERGKYQEGLVVLEACRDLLALCYRYEKEIGCSGSEKNGG